MLNPFRAVAAGLMLAVAVAVPTTVHAADAAKVDRLVELLNMQQQLQLMENAMINGFESGFVDAARKKGASDADIERMRAIVIPAMHKAFDEGFSWSFMKPRLEKIYTDQLTDTEVDAAIAFYGSPAGQSMLAKMPAIAKQAAQVGMDRAREMGPKMDAIMDDALKQAREPQTKK